MSKGIRTRGLYSRKWGDLVYTIICPIINFIRQETTGHNLWLTREKEILSIDEKTGGKEEFVVLNYIDLLIIEAKRSAINSASRSSTLHSIIALPQVSIRKDPPTLRSPMLCCLLTYNNKTV